MKQACFPALYTSRPTRLLVFRLPLARRCWSPVGATGWSAEPVPEELLLPPPPSASALRGAAEPPVSGLVGSPRGTVAVAWGVPVPALVAGSPESSPPQEAHIMPSASSAAAAIVTLAIKPPLQFGLASTIGAGVERCAWFLRPS